MRKERDAVAEVLENCSIADLTTTQPPRESAPESDKDKPTSARTKVSVEESSD
jgi:hypothetical protein